MKIWLWLLIGLNLALPVRAQTTPLTTGIPTFDGPVTQGGIPLNSERLRGLPPAWIQNQYQLYARTVTALNRVLRRSPLTPQDRALAMQLFNRQALYYGFLESLGGEGAPTEPVILKALAQQGDNWESWRQKVLELATATPSGWIVWEYNLLSNSPGLYVARDESDFKLGSLPLIVLNLTATDYAAVSGQDGQDFAARLLANLRWSRATERLNRLGYR